MKARMSRGVLCRSLRRGAWLSLALAVSGLLPGCSGTGAGAGKKPARAPRVEASEPLPDDGSAPPARRAGPALSPAAVEAYDAGMRAFEKADLKGAAEQFGRAL